MLSQLAEAFVLGNASILTNVCVLPLYPSMVAYLAADSGRARGSSGLLGVLVLAAPVQRYLTRGLAGQYSWLTRASGVILVGIGLFGVWAEVLPSP